MDQHNQDFVNEFKYCVRRRDAVKAAALMQFFPSLYEFTRKKILFEIFKAPALFAYPVLETLTQIEINDPEVKEKVRELILEKSYTNTRLIVDYIRKRKSRDKRLYIEIAGELKMKEALPALGEILERESDTGTCVEAVKAIGKIGVQSGASAIAGFIHSPDNHLKTATIQALSELGGSYAVKMLYEGLSGEAATDLVIIHALASIQDRLALEKLTELLSSQFVDLRNAAIDHLIAIGPKAIPVVVDNLKTEDSDTVVHCLNVLGNIGDVTAVPAIQRVIYNCPDDPNIRFAVYEAMERLPSSKFAISLAQGLTDPVDHVRMAAAKAIDKNLSTVLIAGMKNMIEAGDEQSATVVSILIDSGADNAFNFLLESETFVRIAIRYLSESAHPEVRNHFINLLESKGELKLAKRIRDAVTPKTAGRKPVIYAVDDSKMMLRIYMKKLHALGFDSETFEFPAKALEAVKKSKPDLLITDLNMPEINGIQMSVQIRKIYSADELPIIMITTQSDIANQSTPGNTARTNRDLLNKTGINRVLNKPFKDADLKEAISELLNRLI